MRKHSRGKIWRLSALVAPLAVVACVSFSGAAKTKDPPWVAKDWTQWKDDDCDAVLNSSPWGQSADSPGYASTSGPKVSTIFEGKVQLRSALPIRQALLRKLQLDKEYDKMKPDKKQAFDQAHIHDLDPSDQDLIYIKNVALQSMGSATDGRLTSAESSIPATQAALRLSNGNPVQPIETSILGKPSPCGNETQYSFPRAINGKALISQTDSSLVIELGAPLRLQAPFQDSGTGYKFKIADMMYKGKLEY
jgi:hypothetical protein